MSSLVHPVPAPLRPYVEGCVGYDLTLPPNAVHHGLPSTALTVIIAFDEPLDCGWADGGAGRWWTLASGLHARPAVIRTHGHQHGIQLALTPRGARTLLGAPAGELAGQLVDHDDLTGGISRATHERLQHVGWPERFRVLDAALLDRLDRSDRTPAGGREAGRPEVAEAWRVIRHRHGQVRVDRLATHVGWSRRRLLTAFRDELGLGPKEAARVARFQHARDLVEEGSPLAAVAHRAGYADQAHLNREWRALAGETPRTTMVGYSNVQA